MIGYQEIFIDFFYFGQLMVMINVYIGNYGIKCIELEFYSIKINGLICKNYINEYYCFIGDQFIQDYFEEENLVGICSVDICVIVWYICSKGVMNVIIFLEIIDFKVLE